MQQQELFDGKYKILKTLGTGGTSSVFLAENVRLGTLWAIKEIHKQKGQAIHFLTEPHVLKNLRHPALPRIFDIIENEEYLYLIQDYIEGVPLDMYIQQAGTVPEKQLVQWALDICDVYIYLHGQRPHPIIYRDMKPGNLIVDHEGFIKLIDFGIAREFKTDSPNDTVCLGTRGYAAPEQYGTSQTDPRSDVYSLGVTLYHALTGIGPNDPPYELPPLQDQKSIWSADLARIIDKAMKGNPSQRFQTAAEMHGALSQIGTTASPDKKLADSRIIQKGAAIGLGIVGFLFVMGGSKALIFTALSDTAAKTKGFLELIPGLLLCGLGIWLWAGGLPKIRNVGEGDALELDGKGRLKTPLQKSMAFFSPLSTGKTELASSTAVALGKMGKRVILLDLDHETCGSVYNFPVDPGEQFENYYKYRLMVRKVKGYLDGKDQEISNDELTQMALHREGNLLIYSGSQEIYLGEEPLVVKRLFQESFEPALLSAGMPRTQIDTVQETLRVSNKNLDHQVFRYLMRRFRTMADVVILDVGKNTPPELLNEIVGLEGTSKYLVTTENLRDLNAIPHLQRLQRDVDYEDWVIVINQCLPQPRVKDREIVGYFSNPELDWMKFRIRKILRVPYLEGLWNLKWNRKNPYGSCKAFDAAITEIIAAAKIG